LTALSTGCRVGGAGGGCRTSVTDSMQHRPARAAVPTTVYVREPAPASSVETRLHQLDALAAQGTISKEGCQSRRQAILDSL